MKRVSSPMSTKVATAAFLSLFFTVGPLGAAVLFGPTSFTQAANSRGIITTLTNAQLAGNTQLIASYSITRNGTENGDSWFTLGANATAGIHINVANMSDFGALTRTRVDIADTHQFFEDTMSVGTPASIFTSAGDAVRVILNVPTGFTGTSTATFLIDEGTTTFVTADKTLTRTIDWDRTPGTAVFEGAANGYSQNILNFTLTTVPEPSRLMLLGLGGVLMARRRRRA